MSKRCPGRLGPLPELLRHGSEDVASVVTPTGDTMWLIREYALGRLVLRDKRFSRAEAVKQSAPKINEVEPASESMMSMDGAEHARLRRIVAGTFTTGRVAAMTTSIEQLADQHLDTVAASGSGTDLIEALAAPLPLAVLSSLLGVPWQDRSRFRDWVGVLFDISASSPRDKGLRRLELARYMSRLIGHKQRRPGDDLLSAMIGAHGRGELSMEELVTMGLALLMAGYETTVGQIGLSLQLLLSDPTAWEELRKRPDRLAPTAEELIRLTPSTPLSFPRVAVETVSIGSAMIRAGEGVIVSLLDANRDGKVFAEPERLEPDRRGAVHLTFGHGVHRCPGAPLARLQVRIVLERMLRRFPALRLASVPEPVTWKDGLGTRGLSQLLVEW